MKPCKFIKARQNHFYRDLMLKLDKSSTQVVFVENYEIMFFRSDYTYILKYLCRVSFLIILDIYKDYFKSRHRGDARIIHADSALVHHFLWRSYHIFTPRVLWLRSFLIFIVDDLKNFAANNLFQVGELVMYRDPCIIG